MLLRIKLYPHNWSQCFKLKILENLFKLEQNQRWQEVLCGMIVHPTHAARSRPCTRTETREPHCRWNVGGD